MSENTQETLAERVKNLVTIMTGKMNAQSRVNAPNMHEWAMTGLTLQPSDGTQVTYKSDDTITILKLKENFGHFHIRATQQDLAPSNPDTNDANAKEIKFEATHPWALHIPLTTDTEKYLQAMETHWKNFVVDQTPANNITAESVTLADVRKMLDARAKDGSCTDIPMNDRNLYR